MNFQSRMAIGLVTLVFGLTACGGAGGPPVSATIKVQLTRISAPTTAYAVSDMSVTLQNSMGVMRTERTDANGIATFTDSQAPAGLYSVVNVAGANITGTASNTSGREYVKPPPISSAMPLVEYVPNASFNLAASGTYTLNAPVPDIRQVWMLKRQAVSAGGNDNPNFASNSADAFYGRIILSSIHFDPTNGDAINIWSGSDSKFKLFVYEGQNRISNFFNGSTDLGDLAENVTSWPYTQPITLEVPSSTDWAFTAENAAASATKSQNGNAAYNFGPFAGGAASILSIYNNGVTHSPAGTNAMTYEIHRFDPAY